MSFNYTSPLLLQTGITATTFESNPPYEWGWAASGNILLFLDNWANTNNTLTVDVYWGVQTKGLAPINGNIIWKKDPLLTTTYNGSGGTTTDIPAIVELPSVKSRYMKLGFTLGGTTPSIDVQAYFYGKSDAGTAPTTVGSNSATGSAVPANAFYSGGSLAGNLTGFTMTSGGADAVSSNSLYAASLGYSNNGTTWDRNRTATSAAGTTGTGVPAAGMLGFDGTNYQRVKTETTGSLAGYGTTGSTVPANANYIGAAYGPNLSGLQMAGSGGDGSNGNGPLWTMNSLFNGASYDRQRSAVGTPIGTAAVAPRPATSGGVTVAKIASAATTNATNVKNAPGQIYGWSLFNTSAATRYLKFYNLATAPTVGTSVPVFIVPLPAGGGSNIMLGDLGTPFATGIAYSISTGVADTDATATAVNDVVGSVYYA